ncbi:ABC transporter permease [Halobium salinum]|uniref:ABC transporter permease n=1 Tax=Halobium salinum TaxID=1364940 RepID=A0ABD5PCI2_9EURY|nr:ABC transporter permease [Halobium salinum]
MNLDTRLDGRPRLDRRFPATLMAWRNLSRNRLRSTLAALGIVIGVFAIATLGVFGNVLQLSATDSLGDLGTQVVVSPNPEAGVETLTSRDLQEISRATAGKGTAVPLYTDRAVVTGPGTRTGASLYGTADPRPLFEADRGTIPASHRQGALVGSEVATRLGVGVGGVVEVDGTRYRVLAVLAESEGISPVSPDNAVVLPERAFGADGYDQVVIEARSGEAATDVARTLDTRLNVRTERVVVFEFGRILEQIGEFFALLNGFLLGLGAVSLLVAGVSIFNVMLMSTAERRGEIGVLRAVGVQKRDVLRTLLVEAALLGLVGGAVGAVLSVLTVFALWWATPIELAVVLVARNAGAVLVAFGFGVVVSLLSGLYPAWKAASERPAEALRG